MRSITVSMSAMSALASATKLLSHLRYAGTPFVTVSRHFQPGGGGVQARQTGPEAVENDADGRPGAEDLTVGPTPIVQIRTPPGRRPASSADNPSATLSSHARASALRDP